MERQGLRVGKGFLGVVLTVWICLFLLIGRNGIKSSTEVSRVGHFKQVRNLSDVSCHQVKESFLNRVWIR